MDSWLIRLAQGNGLSTETFLRYLAAIANVENPSLKLPFEYSQLWKKHRLTLKNHLSLKTLATHEDMDKLESGTQGLRSRDINEISIFSVESVNSGTLVHRNFLTQYCPQCLSSNKFHGLREWQLPFVILCERHRIYLLERCPQCLEFYYPEASTLEHGAPRCSNAECQFLLSEAPTILIESGFERMLSLQQVLVGLVLKKGPKSGKDVEPALHLFNGMRSNHRHKAYLEELSLKNIGKDSEGIVSKQRLGSLLHVVAMTAK